MAGKDHEFCLTGREKGLWFPVISTPGRIIPKENFIETEKKLTILASPPWNYTPQKLTKKLAPENPKTKDLF